MAAPSSQVTLRAPLERPSLLAHVQIARIDHWVKNVFVIPGIVVAVSLDPRHAGALSWTRLLLGCLATCLIASSNYVINEVMDAPFDLSHPTKRLRPTPSGRVSVPLAYLEWLALMAIGLTLAVRVSAPFTYTMLALWLMGCAYNISPLRTKDLPYLDVLSESVNNPLRLLAGWFIVTTAIIPPASLLLCYWMIGCYFMALKRFAEYRDIADVRVAAAYRKSFAYYTDRKLLTSVMFYSSAGMLFFGAFMMRYRLELVASIPFVALVMAVYLGLSFKPDSVVQRPEGLYREPALMACVAACSIVMLIMLVVDIPLLHVLFTPTAPTQNLDSGSPKIERSATERGSARMHP
jgi:4-hydroxybenzoate polyprenyltransferase